MKAGFPTGIESETGNPAQPRPSSFIPPPPGELARRFPQLEILDLIGQGGMGAVYKARQKELDRIVALKILPPGIGDAAFAERFAREAKALARLNHPGIVTIYEFGRSNGLYFFLMEYVDGATLRQVLQGGPISPREALAIVPAICDALQYAHDQGVVHRDIKPENILLDRRGRTKVADFGLAKLMESDREDSHDEAAAPGVSSTVTHASKVLGTPHYMAPEQIEHPAAVDHRADIYALGVVFYQMLTGELPGQRLEPPSKKVLIDVRLDEVVLRALEKNPALRYAQAGALKTDVETIAMTEQLPGALSQSPESAAAEGGAKHDLRWLLATALVDPCQRAALIQTVEKDIVLPLRLVMICILGYYFFFSGWFDPPSIGTLIYRTRIHSAAKSPNAIARPARPETNVPATIAPAPKRPIYTSPATSTAGRLQDWSVMHATVLKSAFVAYVILNAIVGAILIWSTNLSLGRIQWLLFAVGVLDAAGMGTLTSLSEGFDSNLYLLFPVLILHNALSLPSASLQLLLNFSVSISFLIGGFFDRRMFMSPEDARVENPLARMALLVAWALCCYTIQMLFWKQKQAAAKATASPRAS
jgi:serine/threonine protein kinase